MSISFPKELLNQLVKNGESCDMVWKSDIETEEYTQKIMDSDNLKELDSIIRHMQDKPYLEHNVLTEIACKIMKSNQAKRFSKGLKCLMSLVLTLFD